MSNVPDVIGQVVELVFAGPLKIEVVLVVKHATESAPSSQRVEYAPLQAELPPDLTQMQRDVLEAATFEPKNSKRLAREAGYCYNSWFRRSMAILVEQGLLVRVRGGLKKPRTTPVSNDLELPLHGDDHETR